MRKSFTAVLEKNAKFTADFATEPYEVGWASEALWFIRVLEMSDNATLSVYPQISPDGLIWCDKGVKSLAIQVSGLHSFASRNFGHWLRLQCKLGGKNPMVKVLIYLSLKE